MKPMGYLLCVVVLSAFITSGTLGMYDGMYDVRNCIKCYNCMSAVTKDCLNPKEKLQPQECNLNLITSLGSQAKQYAQSLGAIFGADIDKNTPNVDHNMACQKVVSIVNNEEMVVRSCQLVGAGLDSCQVANKQNAVSHCSVCDSDGCNSGHWMAPLSFAAILVPAFFIRAIF